MKSGFKLLLSILTIYLTMYLVSSNHICSENELNKEILEDLEDNGKLDCLRESVGSEKESEEEKFKREKANWNSDCSAEMGNETHPWLERLEKNYGLTKGLIDVDGVPYLKNSPDQADMCEIIRSLIGNNIFPELGNDVENISQNVVDYIDCVGGGSESSICAASDGNFSEPNSWYIFLDGQGVKFNKKPEYELK